MKRCPLGLFIILFALLSCSSDIYRFKLQKITLQDFQAQGRILDINGGGDGIIGRLKGKQVVAIDLDPLSLEKAPDGPLKIIMDPRHLNFLNNSFETATSFFAFLSLSSGDHTSVFQEVYRVLKSGGKWMIWEAVLPGQEDKDKEFAFLPIHVQLPSEEIKTGYTSTWPEKDHNLQYYKNLAEKAGFKVTVQDEEGLMLYMELTKNNK